MKRFSTRNKFKTKQEFKQQIAEDVAIYHEQNMNCNEIHVQSPASAVSSEKVVISQQLSTEIGTEETKKDEARVREALDGENKQIQQFSAGQEHPKRVDNQKMKGVVAKISSPYLTSSLWPSGRFSTLTHHNVPSTEPSESSPYLTAALWHTGISTVLTNSNVPPIAEESSGPVDMSFSQF